MSQAVPTIDERWLDIVSNTVSSVGIMDDARESAVFNAFSRVNPTAILGALDPLRFIDTPFELGFGLRCYPLSLLVRFLSLVDIKRRSRVLCMGCGGGYLASVISTTGAQVFGVESVGPVIQQTRKNLDAAHYSNVVIHRSDPYKGWPEQGPFEVILIERPLDSVPKEILQQLLPEEGTLVGVQRDGLDWRIVECQMVEGQPKWTKYETVPASIVGKA